MDWQSFTKGWQGWQSDSKFTSRGAQGRACSFCTQSQVVAGVCQGAIGSRKIATARCFLVLTCAIRAVSHPQVPFPTPSYALAAHITIISQVNMSGVSGIS